MDRQRLDAIVSSIRQDISQKKASANKLIDTPLDITIVHIANGVVRGELFSEEDILLIGDSLQDQGIDGLDVLQSLRTICNSIPLSHPDCDPAFLEEIKL